MTYMLLVLRRWLISQPTELTASQKASWMSPKYVNRSLFALLRIEGCLCWLGKKAQVFAPLAPL